MLPWSALIAWLALALLLARSRVPYDDEWFSLELAFDTSWSQFWWALKHDVHPPWVALLDRSVVATGAGAWSLRALRVLASLGGIVLVARTFTRRLQIPGWLFFVAALHPIVVFYAGAVRWYPYLLLAHALRAYAIWHRDRLDRRARLAFVSGCVLGSLAGYVDLAFLVHDGVWLALRGRRRTVGGHVDPRSTRHARVRLLGVFASSALGVAALRVASPLTGRLHDPLEHLSVGGAAHDVLTWFGLGLVGEAGPPFPWVLLSLVCGPAALLAFLSLWRAPGQRRLATWLASYAMVWTGACTFGVWHPRYSLLLWLLVAVLLIRLVRVGGAVARALGIASLAYLSIVLAFTLRSEGFIKADLNRLTAHDCQVVGAMGDGLLVIPYRRIAGLLEAQCPVSNPVLLLPSIRMRPSSQLSELAERIPDHRRVAMLSQESNSSLSVTQRRAAELLRERCRSIDTVSFGEVPHRWLRRDRPADFLRYTLTTYDCGAAALRQ